MGILKWSVRVHKWVALIVGIQIVLWIVGGLVMSAIPIEQVRGEHKVVTVAPLSIEAENLLPLPSIMNRHEIAAVSGAEIGQILGAPVWRITATDGSRYVVDATSGDRLDPIGEAMAREVALADYAGSGTLASLISVEDPPSEYGRPGPVWRAEFNDRDATTLYIDPQSAAVRARRSATWRFYDFFWKLHVMDYDDGEDFNHPLLITAAGAAVFVALSGLSLLIIKMRRTVIAWRRRRAE